MSLLLEGFYSEMEEKAKKMKNSSLASRMTYPIGYPTTFLPLDFMNGVRVNLENIDDDTGYTYDSLGMGEGSIVMLVGKPGSAKTTFAIQAATSIVSRFPNSAIMHEDLEGGTSLPRIQTISGWNSRMMNSQYIIRNEGIDAESFFLRMDSFCKKKIDLAEQYPDQLKYFTGLLDIHGKPVYKLIPSVVILDSLALLAPAGLTEDEKIAGNMSA